MIHLVTGPICAGKSTRCREIVDSCENAGVPVLCLELDRLGHEILDEQGIDEKGRAKIARQVFADPELLAKWESGMHQQIMARAQRHAERFIKDSPDGVVLVESAVPLDADEYTWLAGAEVEVLEVPYQERLARGLEKGMTAEDFDARDAIQQGYDYGQRQ